MTYKSIFTIALSVILISSAFPASAEVNLRPRLSGYMETGEKFLPEDPDYIDQDFRVETSYRYELGSLRMKQNISNLTKFGIGYKHNSKDYILEMDRDLNNTSQYVDAYISHRFTESLLLKLEVNTRNKKFKDNISADKDNDWVGVMISGTIRPQAEQTEAFSFNDNRSEYYLQIYSKEHDFSTAPFKDSVATTVLFRWHYELTDAFTLKFRTRAYVKDYDTESATRKDAVRESYSLGFDYQF